MMPEPAKLLRPLKEVSTSLTWTRAWQIGLSVADQGFTLGGMFLLNVSLARTQTKEEYGIFALSYSIFTFLSGLHNAAILEAYTIHGSGRYHEQFHEYARLLRRANAWLCIGLTLTLAAAWGVLHWTKPQLASRTMLAMALTCGILLMAAFVRRTFYIRRRPDLAARFSAIFFFACIALLLIFLHARPLNGFYAFVIAASAWCIAGLAVAGKWNAGTPEKIVADIEPQYWAVHWKYSRWVFVTALVFQLTGQAYYWLAAVFLSIKDVGELRAMYNLVTPVDQIFAAMILLILPMMSFRFVSRRMVGLLPLWRTYCLFTLLVTSGYAVFMNIFGKQLLHLLYGGKFDDLTSFLGILALLPVVMGVGNTVNAALKASEKPQAVFAAYITSGAATFVLGLPLILRFGMRGAVYGMLASGAIYTATLCIGFFWLLVTERRLSPTLSTVRESAQP
jgi:O-antigen/teichoic acid export membrane protein